jgi:hypothetical protein
MTIKGTSDLGPERSTRLAAGVSPEVGDHRLFNRDTNDAG